MRLLQYRAAELQAQLDAVRAEIRGEECISGHFADIHCSCGGALRFEFDVSVSMSHEDFFALRNFDAPSSQADVRGLATAVCQGCGARRRNAAR